MSLVEATIILLVLMLLTGVLAPSIGDFVNDAKAVKVKEDCEAIGVTVARLTRDVGPCVKFTGTAACTLSNRVDLLFSEGPDVSSSDVTASAFTAPAGTSAAGTYNWEHDGTSISDAMTDQFVTNDPAYTQPGGFSPTSWLNPKPYFNLGWRGAYLQSPIGPDPWGSRYMVNTIFLAVASNATAGTTEGLLSGGWDRDVVCISAGINRLFQSKFGGGTNGGLDRGGDDEIYPISGSTR